MTLIPVTYQPGTIKSRQHTKITSAAFLDTDHVRFQEDGRLATIPAYSQTAHALLGTCRAIYAQRVTGSNSGDCFFFGTHSHLYVEKNGTTYNITPLSQTAQNLGNNPITTTDTLSVVQLTFTDIGVDNVVGDRIKLAALTDVGGITAATYLNKEQIITEIVDDDNIKFDCGFDATSSTTGGGTAPGTVKYQIAAGNESQTTASGMGAGDYGGGEYGGGGQSTTGQQAYPRIWSFGAFGDDVVMCPGDRAAGEGQYIYIWDGDTDVAPTKLTNAPTDCNWVMVVNNAIVALCGRTVKICEPGAGTTWSGLLYYTKSLERIDIAFAGFLHGDKNAIIHHGNGVVLLRYVGGADLWDLSDLPGSPKEGVVSPYSTTELNEKIIWRTPSNIYEYDGGVARIVSNTQNRDWIAGNRNVSKEWHSFAYADEEREEAYFHFPVTGASEPSDYVLLGNRSEGVFTSFTLGEMSRTAAQRPGVFASTLYLADGDDVYRHLTRGAVTFNWYAETAFFYAQKGEVRIFMKEFRPDSNQSGNITLEIIGREYPQSSDVSYGTWTITSSTTVISVKAAGRLLKLKFSGSTEATLGEWMYDIEVLGKRQGKAA